MGGGGHCKSVIEVIESTSHYSIAGIIDNDLTPGIMVGGYPVIGTDHDIPALAAKGYAFHITVGHIKSPAIRINIYKQITQADGQLPVIIAATATVSKRAKIGAGTIIMHKAFVNADASIGSNCIINTGAVVEHDATIGHHCHISTGAYINGGCTVHDNSFIGSSSVLVQGITIATNNIIAAGAVVTHSTQPDGVYAGVPAQLKKQQPS